MKTIIKIAERKGDSDPAPAPNDGKSLGEAFLEYYQARDRRYREAANQIAGIYLDMYPRKESYGVTLTSSEDASELTLYHTLSDKELEILRECSHIAEEEQFSLGEILEGEGHLDLIERFLEHDTARPLTIVDSIDLENPLKFTNFSYQVITDNGELGYKTKIGTNLTDDEFKELLAELLFFSNCYSMNMLVYRKPELCQKIIRHITYASMSYEIENCRPYIADMQELKTICESILNPAKDILGIFGSEDSNIKEFAERHQIGSEY